MTTDHSPWAPIAAGSARRIEADHPSDLFWAVGSDLTPMLLMEFDLTTPLPALPKLRGVSVSVIPTANGRSRLVLELTDTASKDIFQVLCRDLVDTTRSAPNPDAAVHLAVRRTWRWHHLLRRVGSGLLDEESQKGLIGELRLLERLIESHGAVAAVTAWKGPLDAPKDFELGLHAIEAKARRGAATPHVSISNADQLDDHGLDTLLLHVVDLSAAPPGQGLTLSDVAGRVRTCIRDQSDEMLESYESRLASAGFNWSDNYSDYPWLEGDTKTFHVLKAFPRIQSSALPPGVSRVRYTIDLNVIADFETDWPTAVSLITHNRND